MSADQIERHVAQVAERICQEIDYLTGGLDDDKAPEQVLRLLGRVLTQLRPVEAEWLLDGCKSASMGAHEPLARFLDARRWRRGVSPQA